MADLAPRDVFGKALIELARKNERIVALSADLMLSTKLKDFAAELPGRFFETGLTEQATVGVCAGMATCGLIPFFATFAAFAVMRVCEQVRTDITYPKLNVKIVGTHAGLSMGPGGTTHHATEDIAIMRSMANMTVLVPSDSIQTVKVLQCAAEYEGPCYIRLIRGLESPIMIYESVKKCPFEIGKAATIKQGNDVTIIAAGSPVVQESFVAANELEKEGIHARVIDMASVKPIDREAVIKAAEETGAIITVEDHSIIGGLGGAVAEVVVEEKPVPMKLVGIPDVYSTLGPPAELWARYGLNSESLVRTIKEFVGKIK
ncbi:transketolase family protein [Candidatus Aerophobetes bacterium]|nr:transketolase family protein [Candidatus Aerophobetes bacterium]